MTTVITLHTSASPSRSGHDGATHGSRSARLLPMAFIAVLGAATTVQALDTPPAAAQAPAKIGWNDLDTDGNGALNRQEAARVPALAAMFEQADADRNGDLTGEEYRAHIGQGTAPQAADHADEPGQAADRQASTPPEQTRTEDGKKQNRKPHR